MAIVAQAVWASVLILTGSADALTNYVGFAIMLFAGIAVAALFVLRARDPDAPRPFKTLGYPDRARHLRARHASRSSSTPSTSGPGLPASALLVIAAGIPLYCG